jgi:hypothetical protein
MPSAPITFKQWLPIDGRYVDVTIDRSPETAVRAAAAAKALGGCFVCQELAGSGRVVLSFVVGDRCLQSKMCANGPDVPLAVDELVERVCARVAAEVA